MTAKTFAETARAEPAPPAHGLGGARPNFALVVHGGAGSREDARQAETDWLRALLDEARAHLAARTTALDVAAWAVGRMEASGLFNAGRGANPNRDGVRELDAAIMDGATRK